MYGEGVAKDVQKAKELFKLAVSEGDPEVQFNLGFCLIESTPKKKKKKVKYSLIFCFL